MSTKINRIKLKNFIGIYNGLGKEEIEINFNTDKRNILLLGGNGSGKSTILSTLHPFSGTFDERNSIILKDKVGRKEIDITQDGILYKIVHHYESGRNKSTITKVDVDGTTTELNPNGSVRLFTNIIEVELGLTENYFKLIKIGSQAQNFIDLKTTQRKEFISDFTPAVDEYLNSYKVVNNKFNTTTKEIRFITNELEKLQDISSVKRNIDVLSKSEKDIQKKLEDSKVSLRLLQTKKDEIFTKLNLDKDPNALIEELKVKHLSSLKEKEDFEETSLKGNIWSKEEVNTRIEKRSNVIRELEDKLSKSNSEYYSISMNANYINNNLKEVKAKIDSLNLPNIDELFKEDYEAKLNEVGVKIIEDFSSIDDKLITVKAIESALPNHSASINEELTSLSGFISYQMEKLEDYTVVATDVLEESVKTYKDYLKLLDSLENQEKDNITNAQESLKNNKAKLKEYEDLNILATMDSNLESLCAKGKDCCLYEKLVSAKDPTNDKTKLELLKKIEDDEAWIDYSNDSLHMIKKSRINLSKLKDLYENMDVYSKDIIDSFNDSGRDTIIYLIQDRSNTRATLKDIDIAFKTRRDNLKASFRNLLSIQSTINTYKELEINLKDYKHSKEVVIDLTKQKDKFTSEYNEANAKLESIKEVIDEYTSNLESSKKIYEKYLKYLELLNLVEEDEINYNDTKADLAEVLELSSEESEYMKTISMYEEELETIQNDLSKERLSQERINEFHERKNKLEDSRTMLQLVKEALDVKTGIPLILVGEYLDTIRDNCNKLLNIAYKGKFFIDFEISDKDFSIVVFKNGIRSADDISQCSQGEISLVKTSLSLGIIGQAISSMEKHYNVIYLDEIDAEFDYQNRMLFLDILKEQLDALNSEQCFIITHNDCFFNSEAGLVLLDKANVDVDNEEFMANKEILYKVK